MIRKIYISNETVSLVEYHNCDNLALYNNWLDPGTQKGYNGFCVGTFEEFACRDIKQRFFAMIQRGSDKEIIGAVGISPPETIPDLAIWMFKPFRRQGYGTAAFALATQYATDILKITELHAGAYPDNIGSNKMLARCGYVPYPLGNITEKYYLTGEDIIQKDFVYSPILIRPATNADTERLASLNQQLIEDEKHDNPMTVPQLKERMEGFIAGDYIALICED